MPTYQSVIRDMILARLLCALTLKASTNLRGGIFYSPGRSTPMTGRKGKRAAKIIITQSAYLCTYEGVFMNVLVYGCGTYTWYCGRMASDIACRLLC